jgi:hypothetical protein
MPALIEDFETEENTDFSVVSWPVEEEKERLYRKEPESPIVWKFASRPGAPTDTEKILQKLIADSAAILECRDDSDAGFIPYSQETLDRAIDFLTPYTKWAASNLGQSIPIPKLLPGPSGSIDVHWKNTQKELVVNVPADKNANALFYGDDYGKVFIKGSLGSVPLHPSVLWWLITS